MEYFDLEYVGGPHALVGASSDIRTTDPALAARLMSGGHFRRRLPPVELEPAPVVEEPRKARGPKPEPMPPPVVVPPFRLEPEPEAAPVEEVPASEEPSIEVDEPAPVVLAEAEAEAAPEVVEEVEDSDGSDT